MDGDGGSDLFDTDESRRANGTFGPGNKAAKARLNPGHVVPKKFRKQLGEALAYSIVGETGKFRRLANRFLQSEDDRVAFEAFRFLTEQAFGKATIRQEIQTEQRVVAIQFDLGTPAGPPAGVVTGTDGAPQITGGDEHADGPVQPPEGESGSGEAT